mgnify:CR=1 FL=1
MNPRPFLSHKREDKDAVIALKQELAAFGAGGWRDLDDLLPGECSTPGFEDAIQRVTGGFIWYGTKDAAESQYINEVELPAALDRKRKDPNFPLVPVFVDGDREGLLSTVEPFLKIEDFELFKECNGEVRQDEPLSQFHRGIAKRYVRGAIMRSDQTRFEVAATALAEPHGSHDLVLDWRHLIDETDREITNEAARLIQEVLVELRSAFQAKTRFPEISLDLNVPLPIAVLLGYEWRVTSQVRLSVNQRTRSDLMIVSGDGPTISPGNDPRILDLPDDGPTVFVVSTTDTGISAAAETFARGAKAGQILSFEESGPLTSDGIRGLARAVADAIRSNQDKPHPYLLVAGPASLATLIGAASNANGPVRVPTWNGTRYVDGLIVGK